MYRRTKVKVTDHDALLFTKKKKKNFCKRGLHIKFEVSTFKGMCVGKIEIFKELTPRSQTYELHGQEGGGGGGEEITKIKTNTSHCPTKTISRNDTRPLNSSKVTPCLTLKGRVVS